MDDLTQVPTEELQSRLSQLPPPDDLHNIPTHVLQAKLASAEGKPDWNLADNPPPEEAQRRLSDFLGTHAQAFRSWDETAENLKQHFPGVNADELREPYKRIGQ